MILLASLSTVPAQQLLRRGNSSLDPSTDFVGHAPASPRLYCGRRRRGLMYTSRGCDTATGVRHGCDRREVSRGRVQPKESRGVRGVEVGANLALSAAQGMAVPTRIGTGAEPHDHDDVTKRGRGQRRERKTAFLIAVHPYANQGIPPYHSGPHAILLARSPRSLRLGWPSLAHTSGRSLVTVNPGRRGGPPKAIGRLRWGLTQ